LEHVQLRRLIALLVVTIVLATALPLSNAVPSNCPNSGVPVTTNLSLNSNCTYTTQNGILLGKSGITLNCKGHSITENSANNQAVIGVEVIGYSGITIENCKVTGFLTGFFVESSPRTILKGNSASNANYGFEVEYSPFSVLSGSNATTTSAAGFYIALSFNDKLSGNNATAGISDGFAIASSIGTSLSDNNASGNGSRGFDLSGGLPSTQYTLNNNKADNNQYGYYDDTVGAGSLGLGNTYTNNECHGNTIYGSYDGNANLGPAGLCTPQG